MLTGTLVLVLLGVFMLAPGLGVLLFLIILPAYLRTCLEVSRRTVDGMSMSPGDALSRFGVNVGATVAVIAAVIVAGIAALVAVCFASLGDSMIF